MIPAKLGVRFPKGCRVMLSPEGERAILHHIKPWLRRGTVTGYGRDGNILRVQVDGIPNRAEQYGAFFWEPYA